MSDHGALAARARGLVTTVIAGDALAAIDRARDAGELASALAAAGLHVPADAAAVDRLARDRLAADLAILGRWTDALDVIELDEDRRSLRALVRGLAGAAPVARRLAATLPTAHLPAAVLATLAAAPSITELADRLGRLDHPLALALAGARAPIDTLALELALTRELSRATRPRDHAARTYLAQAIDVQNAEAALLLAARGAGISVERAFIPGGTRLDRAAFATAATALPDAAHGLLATAFTGTPLAAALFATAPAALDDAGLAWQLRTQARLRRSEPLGLAPAIYAVLRRRDEARHLRRAAWRVGMAS